MISPKHKADEYRLFFIWLGNKHKVLTSISHHFQYLDFLYQVKDQEEPGLTTLSLLNKTIIVELFSIIEAVIDGSLINLTVNIKENEITELKISEYISPYELFNLAKEYGVIDDKVHSELKKFNTTRNLLHIKRRKEDELYEYERYTNKLLLENEKIFKNFIRFLLIKNSNIIGPQIKKNMDIYGFENLSEECFPWPRSNFGKEDNLIFK